MGGGQSRRQAGWGHLRGHCPKCLVGQQKTLPSVGPAKPHPSHDSLASGCHGGDQPPRGPKTLFLPRKCLWWGVHQPTPRFYGQSAAAPYVGCWTCEFTRKAGKARPGSEAECTMSPSHVRARGPDRHHVWQNLGRPIPNAWVVSDTTTHTSGLKSRIFLRR